MIIIAGPTAVGKTSLCVDLAKKYNCDIFSCDSRQIYKEMSIGTAKPTPQEMQGVIHHFINTKSITELYSAGDFERDFDREISSYFSKNNIAILTGGTGMYIKAALEGLDKFPTISPEVKQHIKDLLESKGIDALAKEVVKRDPIFASQVDLKNKRRLTRALEVIYQTDLPFSSFHSQKMKDLQYTSINICLARDREELYTRINNRVEIMLENGLEDEVRSLYPYRSLRALDTVGYKELFSFIDGDITRTRAVELIKQNTRRYAKRQITWFKNQGTWKMISADDYEGVLTYIKELLQNGI